MKIPLKVKKNNIDSPAPTGNVTTQETIIRPTTVKSTADNPLARPTPSTAPTSVCVVEMGNPVPEAKTTVVAAASSAANPLLGVNSVIFLPTVSITLYPRVAHPATIPVAPSKRIHHGIDDFAAI